MLQEIIKIADIYSLFGLLKWQYKCLSQVILLDQVKELNFLTFKKPQYKFGIYWKNVWKIFWHTVEAIKNSLIKQKNF